MSASAATAEIQTVWWCARERFVYWRKPEKEPHRGEGCCQKMRLVPVQDAQ